MKVCSVQTNIFPKKWENSSFIGKFIFPTRLVKIVLSPSIDGKWLILQLLLFSRLKTDGESTIFTKRVGKNNLFYLWKTIDCQFVWLQHLPLARIANFTLIGNWSFSPLVKQIAISYPDWTILHINCENSGYFLEYGYDSKKSFLWCSFFLLQFYIQILCNKLKRNCLPFQLVIELLNISTHQSRNSETWIRKNFTF